MLPCGPVPMAVTLASPPREVGSHAATWPHVHGRAPAPPPREVRSHAATWPHTCGRASAPPPWREGSHTAMWPCAHVCAPAPSPREVGSHLATWPCGPTRRVFRHHIKYSQWLMSCVWFDIVCAHAVEQSKSINNIFSTRDTKRKYQDTCCYNTWWVQMSAIGADTELLYRQATARVTGRQQRWREADQGWWWPCQNRL
jgi:hypothetical protein